MRIWVSTLVIFLLCLSGCYVARVDGPYRGKVIDADTREPVEGVVVLGTWCKEIITPGGGVHNYYDAMETMTDKNGEFEIKGLGLMVISNVIPMDVLIFKAGYQYKSGPWSSLENWGWTGRNESYYDPDLKMEVTRRAFDTKMKVTWDGDRAIIPIKKLTMEERKKQGTPDFYVGQRYDKKENMTHSCLPRNIRLLPKEVNKELIEQGLKAYDLEGGRCEE